jgi:hypothetical protein
MQKKVAPNAGTRTRQPIRWGAVDYAGSDPLVLGGQVSGAEPAKAVALQADGVAEPGVSLNSVEESGEAVADARRRPIGPTGPRPSSSRKRRCSPVRADATSAALTSAKPRPTTSSNRPLRLLAITLPCGTRLPRRGESSVG